MKTVYTLVSSPTHAYAGHPESPQRFARLEACLSRRTDIERLEAAPARLDEISRVHTPRMITGLEAACRQGPGIIDHAPTYVTRTSFDDALLASGGTLACSRLVWEGAAPNGFALVRPPGHHAEPGRAMGFCLFNNAAVAAKDALARGLERALIVDFDAHHGNGTQAAFRDDERVAYLSTHQEGIYPGSGRIEDVPHAKGRIVNVPLPAFSGDAAFRRIAEAVITPLAARFRPQMIFVSAGFDSHWNDPLTSLGLTSAGFFVLAQRLVGLAQEHCGGKIVFVLEGGYDPQNVADGATAVFAALTGSESAPGGGDASPHPEPDITPRLDEVRRWQGL
ncbi:MAG: histone deacetylase [Chloroflexi bacterium]|nr:histone deacetylase [Chloroflexota bacterium]